MTIVRELYARFRHLIHEAAKFGIVGIVGVIITDGGTNLLKGPLDGWLKANIVATVVATVVAYLASRYWTFRHRERSNSVGRESALFFLFNGIGLVIQLVCLGFTNYALGRTDRLSSNIALLLGIMLATLFRWWSYRRFVWTAPRDNEPAVTEEQAVRLADPAAALALPEAELPETELPEAELPETELPEPLDREPETVPPGRGGSLRDEAGRPF